MTRVAVETPRWLFLAALVLAPWVYGTTPPWAIAELEMLLSVILVLWMASCAMRALKPAVHPLLLRCVIVILAGGWWMALNPHFQDTGYYMFARIPAIVPFAPGTVDGRTSCLTMLRVTCLLGTVCFVCDLSARRGKVEGMEQRGNSHIVRAQVPLSDMFGYATDLRSRTQGRATYSMQFHAYNEVPESIAKEIIAKARGE